MVNKRKERMQSVVLFILVIVTILATTKFYGDTSKVNSVAVFSGLGVMFGTLLHYFSKEDKRNS